MVPGQLLLGVRAKERARRGHAAVSCDDGSGGGWNYLTTAAALAAATAAGTAEVGLPDIILTFNFYLF